MDNTTVVTRLVLSDDLLLFKHHQAQGWKTRQQFQRSGQSHDPCADYRDVIFLSGHAWTPFDWNTVPLGYPTARYEFSITPNVLRAKSEGVVRLRSHNSKEAPRIDFRYFT